MRYLITLVTFLLAAPWAFAGKVDSISAYVRNIAYFNRFYPQEKVYIHMDNRSYFLGDTIWFKAYVVEANTHELTTMSKILYVELLNESGVLLECKKLQIVDGMCHGEFALDEEYRTGYYELRAYTRYMLNFGNNKDEIKRKNVMVGIEGSISSEGGGSGGYLRGRRVVEEKLKLDKSDSEDEETREWSERRLRREEWLNRYAQRDRTTHEENYAQFSRVFPVYLKPEVAGVFKREMDYYPLHPGLAQPQEPNYELRKDNLTLTFYPEGGNLVEGIPTIVSFEAMDQWGRKRNVSGYITDGAGAKIVSFRAMSKGRGSFVLSPDMGQNYTAHVKHNGKEYAFTLPQAIRYGYGIQLTSPVADGSVRFCITASANKREELLGWTIQCRGSISAYDTLTLGKGDIREFVIPYQRMIPGVNQLTLFNARGEILADRLFFVSPIVRSPKIALSGLPTGEIKPYEKVTLNFGVRDTSDIPAHSCFSLSVTDADERGDSYDSGDIRSYLLLSSDLKGFIENVDSYFSHDNDSMVAKDLDMLMRIQGWRRYEWCAMAGSEPFEYLYTPERHLGIDGYVISDELDVGKNPFHPDEYERLPHLKVKIQIGSSTYGIDTVCYADDKGEFAIDFDRRIFGTGPMTITLTDTLDLKIREGFRKYSRLKYSHPIIRRAFSPEPDEYTFYEQNLPADDYLRQLSEQMGWMAEMELPEVTIRKRRKRTNEVYYDRPEMVIDYSREWNSLIDRGIPLVNGNYKNNDGKVEGYTNNIISPHYSLVPLRIYSATIKDDNVVNRYYRSSLLINKYVLPRNISVYSNVLSRGRLSIDNGTANRPHAYLKIEYYSESESPIKAPFMPKGGVRDTYYDGYSIVKDYYNPDYSGCALPDSADCRRTLYWNPDVRTDDYGKASVTFYNSKQTKHLHVRAEGITAHGEFIVYDSEKNSNETVND